MVAAMKSIETLPKNGRNTYSNYNYVTDEDVMEAMRHALANAGIALVVSVDTLGQEGNRTFVWLNVSFVDGDTGERETVRWYSESLTKTQDKACTIAITSGVKYCLLKTFLVSTGDEASDGDSDIASKEDGPKQPAQNLATGKQKAAISSMIKNLAGNQNANVDGMLVKRGYARLSKITKSKASELIGTLKEKLAEKEKAESQQEEPSQEDPFR
jgi:hypothetical protein